MKWVHDYQLFLFDFDGILVNTEALHYKAYLQMCADRGFSLKWDQRTYMSYALYTASGVKEAIYQLFPELEKQEPSWDVLYQEKKKIYSTLLRTEGPPLMPGVVELLEVLKKANIKRCVVTHSPADQIALIRSQHPVLNTIPHWITREQYKEPKPSSECYKKAIHNLKSKGDRIIGFEDSPRGLKALMGTEAEAVLVTEFLEPKEIKQLSQEFVGKFSHCASFFDLIAQKSN